jgi:hypothetical protein
MHRFLYLLKSADKVELFLDRKISETQLST